MGPLNYIQINDLIAFIRAPSTQEYTRRTPQFNEPIIGSDGKVLTFKGWRDTTFKPDPSASPVPDCYKGDPGSATPAPAASLPPNAPTFDLIAVGFAFDKKTLDVAANTAFVINLDNQDAAGTDHNVELLKSDGSVIVDPRSLPVARRRRMSTTPASRHVHVHLPGPSHPGDDRHLDGQVAMAKALPAGRPIRRRPMFGLFDGEGWAWATTKALFWLLVIIMVLGYIPDRAYYFMVSRTMDVGLVLWSPVNLCPPENGSTMPCPVPVGGVLPWQASPAQVALPAPRTSGVAAQLGTNLLYIGGSDGTAASATTFATQVDKGNFGAWAEGPALPAARTDASLAILSGTAYLMGGLGPDGAPTTTVWSIGLDPATSALTTWTEKTADGKAALPTLPAPRSGAAAVAVADGIVIAGGRGADGKPTSTVWKATVDSKGVLGRVQGAASAAAPDRGRGHRLRGPVPVGVRRVR